MLLCDKLTNFKIQKLRLAKSIINKWNWVLGGILHTMWIDHPQDGADMAHFMAQHRRLTFRCFISNNPACANFKKYSSTVAAKIEHKTWPYILKL